MWGAESFLFMSMKKQQLYSLPFFLSSLLLLPCLSMAASVESGATVETVNGNRALPETNEESNLLDQLKLFFHIRETTRALDLEESGISGLGDTAGQSAGNRQLLILAEKYYGQVSAHPEDAATWLKLGTVLETLGREEEAVAAYKKSLDLNPGGIAARQGIRRYNRLHQILVRAYSSLQQQTEYAPSIQADIATWEEQAASVQVSKSWGRGKTFGIGWLQSSIYQKNELYNDVDFSLTRRAPFAYFSWPLLESALVSLRIRDEEFTNKDNSGFYRLDSSEHIVTGYLSLAHRDATYWVDLTYSREREPDPIYDPEKSRSALNIEVKELSGISGGYALAPSWELGGSLYYEQYGSGRSDQFNPNIQLSHWPQWLPGMRISLGYGYYTDEQENILNLLTSYQWQPVADMLVRVEYQLEYSDNEDSLLNQGDILFSWTILQPLSLTLRADYSQESGGDEDGTFFVQASLNFALE